MPQRLELRRKLLLDFAEQITRRQLAEPSGQGPGGAGETFVCLRLGLGLHFFALDLGNTAVFLSRPFQFIVAKCCLAEHFDGVGDIANLIFAVEIGNSASLVSSARPVIRPDIRRMAFERIRRTEMLNSAVTKTRMPRAVTMK